MNPETSYRRRMAILFLLATTGLVVVMDLTILNVALTTIQRDLKASQGDLQWSLDAYLITFAAFLFTGGACADRFGRRATLLTGLLVFGAASALAAASGSIGELIAWRAVMGVGAAIALPTTMGVLINVFPQAERPRAIAVWAGTAGLAVAVGPLIGGLLLSGFWWGSVFLINVPIVVVAVVAIRWLVPESRSPQKSGFDPVGLILPIAGVGLLVYGIINGGETDSWLSVRSAGSMVLGAVLLAVLVLYEARREVAALDVKLFRSSRFSAGIAAIALCFFAMIGALFVTSLYFQSVRGFSPLKAGLMMLPMGLGLMVMSSRCPKLAKRFGARLVVGGGALVMTFCFLGYAQVGTTAPIALLVVLQLLFGLGWGGIMAPATAALMSVVPPARASAGQAVAQTMRQISGALGVAVIGTVLGVVYRSSFGPTVNALPSGLRAQANASVGATLGAVQAAGRQVSAAQASAITSKALSAYESGMSATMYTVAVVSLAAALVAYRWLPGAGPAPAAQQPRPDTARKLSST